METEPGEHPRAETLRAFLEFAPDAIVIVETDGRILLVNGHAERLFGYDREELIGRSIEVLLPGRYRVAHVAHRADYTREPAPRPMGVGLALSGERKDGTEFPVDISLSPLHTQEGLLLAAAIRDITERRQVEDALRISEERFRAVLEFAPDAIVIVAPDGLISLVNAQTERLFGYDREELIGQKVELLLPERFHGAHARHRQAYLAEPGSRPMGVGLDLLGRRKDGSEFPVDISLSPLRTGEGLLLAAAIRDITERRRLERARDEFIANAAHELRTPLATLAGLGETLAIHFDRMTIEQRTAALEALSRQGRRASALVANLLDLSQIESGRARIELEVVDVPATFKRVLDVAPAPADVTITVHTSDHVDAIADPLRLEQVLTNLLTNAYRYGGPKVELTATTEDGTSLLTVADDGPGISDDLLPRLFESFATGRAANAPAGSGIGLALCRRLVEAFGGTIWYERPAVGARFCIKLRRPS